MSDEVEQIEPEDDEIDEEWIRWTDSPDLRGVDAYRVTEIGYWMVSICAQAFYRRQDPLGVELRQRVQGVLRAVAGVTAVHEHNNVTWDVRGTPSGEALTLASASVVDDMADRLRQGH
ncbi:MAG: hypothetical protein ACRDRJ_41265 [Streptosporangiaceae bacterium]